MNRRRFLKNGLLFGSAAVGARGAGTNGGARSSARGELIAQEHDFRLDYAPKFGTFEGLAGPNLIDQLEFMAEMGFKGLTDDGMGRRDPRTQREIAAAMERLGLRMGVFAGHTYYWDEPNLASGDAGARAEFLDEIRAAVELADRINGKWMTVMPGHRAMDLEVGYQRAHVIEALRAASEILEPHRLVMVIEPVNRNYPGLFLTDVAQAYGICRAVDSPSCKILFDLYHQQINAGNLIPNIDRAWTEIGIFQLADNPGRDEPFTGEINYREVLGHLQENGYDGLIGMEHGNSADGVDGERRVLQAYVRADGHEADQ